MQTLQEAKDFVLKHSKEGTTCPCCSQFVKIYRRKLNAAMAVALILVYREFLVLGDKTAWVHVPSLLSSKTRSVVTRGGDWAKLTYWGLLEAQQGVRADGSGRVGFYKMTALGEQFVTGSAAVPKYAYVYNQQLLQLSPELTTILEALGSKFDYAQLMRG